MFEPFVNKLKGKDASSSSNALKGMYQRFHIDNARSLVFGDGLYTDGSASGGTELINFTLSSSVMTVSSSGATEGVSGGMKGGGRPQR